MPSSDDSNKLKHLLIKQPPFKEKYTSPKRFITGEFISHIREKDLHGQNLRNQLKRIEKEIPEIKKSRLAEGFRDDFGIYIEFESAEENEINYESLEDARAGIEVTNIREESSKTFVTVYVPDGKLKTFYSKIEQYLDLKKYTKKNRPKNQKLIETISGIRLATLKAFWTGVSDFENIPNNENRWWEVWLRTGQSLGERNNIEASLIEVCSHYKIILNDAKIDFPERVVYLIKTSKKVLSQSFIILDLLAEIRNPQETAQTFMEMPLNEQREWVDELLNRITVAEGSLPAVCIIDTGVNNGHPLLSIALDDSDMTTYNPAWGTNDSEGHGTGMAGLALYGDLFDPLTSKRKISLVHKLESVKLLYPSYNHEPELYGAVTSECINRAIINRPERNKIFCMATSSEEDGYEGQPTSWSAALDKICFAETEKSDKKKNILVSAGNIRQTSLYINYPEINERESIQDPGQSWNSITVGGYTRKNYIDSKLNNDLEVIAPPNELSPSSTTSVTWEKKWPVKPEIVLEAGNYLKEKLSNFVSTHDSLSLLTTNARPTEKLFCTFGDTSASTALASRFMAIIQYSYPDYWPETIRGLIIHSAEWTKEMLNSQILSSMNYDGKRNLLRKYGYGVPSLDRALWCVKNYSTLIIEDSLFPFYKNDNIIKTNEVNFHSLPLPKEFFQELGNAQVKLKITLSYFIEPNPTHRKYLGKYDYASFGLRFDLKKGTEDIDEFRKRVNKEVREESDINSFKGLNWLLGPTIRNAGSIHSDTWTGLAAELAIMDTIAVYPVSGWWRTRKKLERWNNSARYSIIISIETEDQEIDIYTPIKNIIDTPITIPI